MIETSNKLEQISDEVKQLRNEVKQMRDEMKQVISGSKTNPGNIWSIRNIFTQSYLDGLRELANESLSGFVKMVWCSILLVSLILVTYQITKIAKDYADEVTVTQIGHIETNLTEVNRPSICYTVFPDFLYRQADRGSLDDLEPLDNDSLLYMGYIKAMMPHFASSGLWLSHIPSENLTWSQFELLAARPWLSMSQENASLLSQNTLYNSLYYWGIGQLSAPDDSEFPKWELSQLSHVPTFYSDLLSRSQSINGAIEYVEGLSWICMAINFSTSNNFSPSGKRLQWFAYKYYAGEPASLEILHRMEFSVVHFNAKHYPLDILYATSFLERDAVYKQDTVTYMLIPTKFQHSNLSRQKCYDAKGEIYPRGYGETICFHDCLWENHARLFNCSFWEDFSEHPSIKVCHIFDIFDQVRSHMSKTCLSDGNRVWCNNETSHSVDEWNGLILQTYRDKVINEANVVGCKKKCADWMFCDEWEFEYGLLYKHESSERSKSSSNRSGHAIHRDYTVSNYISVNREVLKASFEEFVANFGGIIGIYFGVSICGCLHLLLFLSINCCGKVFGLGKNRHIQVADDRANTTKASDKSKTSEMVDIE